MRFLLELEPGTDLDALAAGARAAHAAGLDGVLLRESAELPAPLIAAAALAARTPDVLLAVEVGLGVRHPFEIAEEAAVTDLASGGRLILVARPAGGQAPRRDTVSRGGAWPLCGEDYAEALDLVRAALTPRPFRFEGRRWKVPANLAENVHGLEERVRMMPAPAQVRLELWGSGAGRDAALARGLGHLADADADPAELAAAHEAAGPSGLGAPRARRETLGDADELVARLRAGREAFGQDWAVVTGDAHVLGTRVRPRVQLHRLNAKLEELWAP
jgi:alkanesulfonate monooxygenase SsuD/methylene tetrahydromethanopterin reductase-like flavin-dependent oxidoreductase (luciferase family)